MAVLSDTELAEIRRRIAAILPAPDYTKEDVNEALQATEDWFEANKAALVTYIDSNTTFSFSGQEKKYIVAYWLLNRAFREEQ